MACEVVAYDGQLLHLFFCRLFMIGNRFDTITRRPERRVRENLGIKG